MHPFTRGMLALAGVLWALAPVAPGQTISIVSGNGQVICPSCIQGGNITASFAPMTVVVKDASGNPVANAAVYWIITGSGTLLAPQQTTTQADGTSFNILTPGSTVSTFGQSYAQATVQAFSTGGSVNFYETVTFPDNNGKPLVLPVLTTPPPASISGTIGQPSSSSIVVSVQTIPGGGANLPPGFGNPGGVGIPNIQVALVPANTDPTAGPVISCVTGAGQQTGTVLTDANGNATCTPTFSGKAGTSTYSIGVGAGWGIQSGFNFTVTGGVPTTFRLISGNNQNGNPSISLPQPLIAELDDPSGAPLSGIPVTWTVVSGSATLVNAGTTTDQSGRTQTGIQLGATPGPVQIKVSATNAPTVAVVFNATVNAIITSMQKLAGDNQSAAFNTDFAPLTVQVNNGSTPVQGATIQFSITGGSGTLGASSAVTNAAGQASVTVHAGSTAGPLTVVASAGSQSATFNLTVRPPGPSITSASFVSAASPQVGLAPCGLGMVTGSGLATGLQGAVVAGPVGPWPLLLAKVSIQFGGTQAPIYAVSNISGQESVTFQVPCEVVPGTAAVTVTVDSGSASVNVPVSSVAPGIFQTTIGMSDNLPRAVLVRPDGSFVSTSNPARLGETIRMYATGLGQTTPAVGTDQFGMPDVDMNTANTIIVGVANAGVPVISAKYAPNMIGVYEISFQIPPDSPTGMTLPFAIAVVQGSNPMTFGNPSMIPVQ